MTVGLLECDHVPAKFRHLAGDYYDLFGALFPHLDLRRFNVCHGQFPDSVTACDAYLCTGSKYSVYDEVDWIKELQRLVQELYAREKTYVGVCFGNQLLGEALGGRVTKAAVGWCVGAHTFQVTQPKNWMTPFQGRYRLLMMCQDQIVELPPDSRVLAAAPDCPVGMLRVGPRMLGVQAHPEFPVAYERALLEDRVERIGAEKVAAGLDSLALRLDAEGVGEWLGNFIRGTGS
ncbi:MAG: hypothetical protein LH618_19385 [Saprospiraceae bacterium]|nr:hypothetical protein [Saprospiraceae bacterium]